MLRIRPLSKPSDWVTVVLLPLLLVTRPASADPIGDVRTLYLVPSDAVYNQSYADGIIGAIKDLQQWYAGQLGGNTFVLGDPLLEVISTSHPASFYSTTPNVSFESSFFYNVVNEAIALAGAQFDDLLHRWLVYIDAEPLPGQIGGAALRGIAELPQHDLLGLVGAQPEPLGRWIGGLGHELGHTLGLPHPPSCEEGLESCPSDALMWLGYITYPNTFLLPEEKEILLQSPFIAPAATASVLEPETLSLAASGLLLLLSTRRRPCQY